MRVPIAPVPVREVYVGPDNKRALEREQQL